MYVLTVVSDSKKTSTSTTMTTPRHGTTAVSGSLRLEWEHYPGLSPSSTAAFSQPNSSSGNGAFYAQLTISSSSASNGSSSSQEGREEVLVIVRAGPSTACAGEGGAAGGEDDGVEPMEVD